MRNQPDRNEQLDRYLDGSVSPDELPEELVREERQLRELLGTLKEDVEAPRTLLDSVMREVAEISVSPGRRFLDWCFRPRSLSVSPARAATLAFAASAVLIFVSSQVGPVALDDGPTGAVDEVVTRFVFVAPEAQSVHLTGDFISWSPEGIALVDLRGTGIWTLDVPLPTGVHQYTFIVNGSEWQPDPRAVSQVDDGFGRVNSVVIVSDESAA